LIGHPHYSWFITPSKAAVAESQIGIDASDAVLILFEHLDQPLTLLTRIDGKAVGIEEQMILRRRRASALKGGTQGKRRGHATRTDVDSLQNGWQPRGILPETASLIPNLRSALAWIREPFTATRKESAESSDPTRRLYTYVHRGVRLSPGMPHSGSRRYRAKIRLPGACRLRPTELRGIKRRNSKTKIFGAGGPTATNRSHWLSGIRIVDRHPAHRGLDGQRLYSDYNPDDCDQRG
jgi:hypothetical protein